MLNQIVLMGRMTRDIELRYLQNTDTAVGRFSLAVERDYKAANEERPKTDFINCTAWNNTAEFISKYFPKGSMIALIGSLETGSYTDRDTGKTVYTTDIKVQKVFFTGEKRQNGNESSNDGFMNIPDGIDEELPFN